MCLVNCFMLYDLTNHPPSTAHGKRQLTFRQKLVRQLIGTFTSRKRTGRKSSLTIRTAFPNLFHTLQKVSSRAKVCALCVEEKKKAPSGRGNRQHINVSSVTFHCAVWGVFWNTTSSEMWRCKIRQVGYYMHKFITTKMKKAIILSFLVCDFFFLEGRPVSGVVRKFKCLLKKCSLTAHAVGF